MFYIYKQKSNDIFFPHMNMVIPSQKIIYLNLKESLYHLPQFLEGW